MENQIANQVNVYFIFFIGLFIGVVVTILSVGIWQIYTEEKRNREKIQNYNWQDGK